MKLKVIDGRGRKTVKPAEFFRRHDNAEESALGKRAEKIGGKMEAEIVRKNYGKVLELSEEAIAVYGNLEADAKAKNDTWA